jgi:hypothetical protein
MTIEYKSIITSPEYLTALKKSLRDGQVCDYETGRAISCDTVMDTAADVIEVLQERVTSMERLLKIIHHNANVEGMVGFREWCSGTIEYKLKHL